VSDASLYKDDPFNMETANRHVALFPQIESVKGVENIDEIACVEGISGLMFGPGDFMADAGPPIKMGGEPHPVFADAMAKFAAAGAKYNLPLMGLVDSHFLDCHPAPLSLPSCRNIARLL
jgi:4-hydroxy-2-oxoheptanedioate aldolase